MRRKKRGLRSPRLSLTSPISSFTEGAFSLRGEGRSEKNIETGSKDIAVGFDLQNAEV